MGVNKRLQSDNLGVIPVIAWVAILVVGAVGTWVAIENLSQQPDITYTVTQSPFSFFGNQIDWVWIIIIGVVIVFALLWFFGKGKTKPKSESGE